MTPTPALLRGLVAANAVLFQLVFVTSIGFGIWAAEVDESLGSEQASSVGAPEVLACCAVVFLVPAHLAGLVGLYLMRNWGRWLNLAMLIVINGLSLLTSLFDVSMTWGFPSAVAQVEAIVSGVILGLAFFSSLAREFPMSAVAENR